MNELGVLREYFADTDAVWEHYDSRRLFRNRHTRERSLGEGRSRRLLKVSGAACSGDVAVCRCQVCRVYVRPRVRRDPRTLRVIER